MDELWREGGIIYQQQSMFFGKILSGGQSFKFSPEEAAASQGEVLSITNVVLAPSSKDQAALWANKDGQELLIATLTREHPHAALNLFISLLDGVTILNKGNGTLHVTGFYEPDEVDPEEEEEEEGEEAEGKETAVVAKPTEKKAVPVLVAPEEEDDDEDEDADFEVDEEVDDELDEDDEEDE
jgi:hypothetical protein